MALKSWTKDKIKFAWRRMGYKNYRIGQKIIIEDSGRFSAAMLELVRFLLILIFFTVKPTTTTTTTTYERNKYERL